MNESEQRIAIGEIDGWRRWQFGDPFVKGLRLADNRFNGYVRYVTKNAPADSKTVMLNVDEAETHQVSKLVEHFTPVSHWVKNGIVKASLPNYFRDLNVMHALEMTFNGQQYEVFCGFLSEAFCWGELGKTRPLGIYSATAAHRASAFYKTFLYLQA